MQWKSEKGVTGIDISIAVVLIFIFITVISVLSYNFSSKSQEMEKKSEAVECAIAEIERIKGVGIDESYKYDKIKDYPEYPIVEKDVQIPGKDGFFKTVKVEDYVAQAQNDSMLTEEEKANIKSDLVKRVTVIITYKYKKELRTVELSTILTKGA